MHITRSVDLPVTVEDAWELLTDAAELGTWLGHVDVPTLDAGQVAALVEPDGTARTIRIDAVVPGERIALTWWRSGADDESHVDLVVAPADGCTRVTVTERPGPRASVAGGIARLAVGGGWTGRLVDLELRALVRQAVLV